MFKKLFGKLFGRKAKTVPQASQEARPGAMPEPAPALSDDDELDRLITVAADRQTPEDQDLALAAFRGRQFFMNIGRDSEGRMTMSTGKLENGLQAVVLYAVKDHPALVAPFGGIMWEEACDMVQKLPDNAALLVQSRGTGWIAIDQKGAAAILRRG